MVRNRLANLSYPPLMMSRVPGRSRNRFGYDGARLFSAAQALLRDSNDNREGQYA
jgi:hypothetical protein